MTDEEMDDLWIVMRPYCEQYGITREQFEIGTRIIEAIKTPEQAEAMVRYLKGEWDAATALRGRNDK